MKIYLAGKWDDRAQIRTQMQELERLGHQITYDWTVNESIPDRGADHLGQCAMNDLQGVAKSQTVVALMTDPDYAYRGTFTEIGCAVGLGRQVIIVCPEPYDPLDPVFQCQTNCFYHHPGIQHVRSWEDLINFLEKMS